MQANGLRFSPVSTPTENRLNKTMLTPTIAEHRWKRIKDQLAADEEMSRRITARSTAFMERWSKASKRGKRVHADVEEKMLKKMAHLMGFGHRFALIDTHPSLVPSFVSPPPPGKRKKKTKRRVFTIHGRLNREANKRIVPIPPYDPAGSEYVAWFPTWDHIAPLTRALCYGMAIPAAQRFTLNLNLTPKITEDALRSKNGIARYFQDRLHRFMRNALPGEPVPDFLLVVEGWGAHEDLHLHGAINLPPRLARGAGRDIIKTALKRAAGHKASDKHTGTELDAQPIYEAAGWFRYLGKRRMVSEAKVAREQRRLGLPVPETHHHLIVATQPLRRGGKKWFEDARDSGRVVLWNERIHGAGSLI